MGRVAAVALLVAVAVAFFVAGGQEHLSFEALKAREQGLRALCQQHPAAFTWAFFGAYVLLATLSLPGGAILTMAAGALFGALWGTLIVSFASSIGATGAFLISRYLFRDWLRRRFGTKLERLEAGVKRDGALYLFGLRLVPAVPFFAVNLGMGLTPMRPGTYYWVTQLGMLPGTALFASAGTRLSGIERPSEVLSPAMIGTLVLLAALPLVSRVFLNRLRVRRRRAHL
jgi:uncharacterized membrane protein YdjX (TVP38/TMEM64 family)